MPSALQEAHVSGNTHPGTMDNSDNVFLLDVDGSGDPGTNIVSISPETRHALRRMVDRGVNVVLATGCSIAGLRPVAQQLGIQRGMFIASHGAVIGEFTGQWHQPYTITATHTFSARAALSVAMSRIPDVHMAVEYAPNRWMANTAFVPGTLHGRLRLVHERKLWTKPITRAVLHAEGVTDIARDIHAAGVNVVASGSDWVDITPRGVSKGTAMDAIRRGQHRKGGTPQAATVEPMYFPVAALA